MQNINKLNDNRSLRIRHSASQRSIESQVAAAVPCYDERIETIVRRSHAGLQYLPAA